MHRLLLLSLVFCIALLYTGSHAENLSLEEKSRLSNELTAHLAKATNPDDSLKILYNLFDLSTRTNARQIAYLIFDVAGRAGNTEVQNDILRQTCNIAARFDSVLSKLLVMASALPDNYDRRETETFIKMTQARSSVREASEPERQKKLNEMIVKLNHDKPVDIYEQILITYSICCFLNQSQNPTMAVLYFNELLKLVEQVPTHSNTLRNLVYTRGSTLFSTINDYERAIELDRKILEVADSLETKYHQEGRIYRNYDASRYARYMSILFNYPALTNEEVDSAYEKVKYYAQRDSDALISFRYFKDPTICLLMAKHQYNEVIPMIMNQIKHPSSSSHLRRYYEYLLEAADSTNNIEAYIFAAKNHIDFLKDYIRERGYEKYRELQILYDVYDLHSTNDKLEIEARKAEIRSQRTIIIIVVISLIVLGGFFIILFRLYRKAQNLSKSLVAANDSLIEESANLLATRDELVRSRDEAREASLRKNDIISNISNEVKIPLQAISEYSRLIVDCIDTEKQPFLNKYADYVELNTDLLNTVINDVTSLSELDNDRMSVSYYGVNVNQMCEMAISSIAHRVNPDVDLEFIPGDPSLSVSTDPRRVEQILIGLLSNAAKFTETGSIILSYEIDNASNRLVFIVTDTGIGIPADKSEVIFDRFVKLDRNTQGPGLGLTIARMIAHLIGGDIRLDTTYTQGAQFRFFIPLSR